jgi:organic hydroperoxide reductase OsmC/OhrA
VRPAALPAAAPLTTTKPRRRRSGPGSTGCADELADLDSADATGNAGVVGLDASDLAFATTIVMASTHRFQVLCSWSGSTAAGYEGYDRSHQATTVPPSASVRLTADPAFRGDPALLNPEQLVVMAASSCQLLTFLAVAARARIDVIDYEDSAEGFMPEEDRPMRLTRIELRPTITVAPPVQEDRVRHLVEQAHRDCFIANTLRSEILVTPTIVIAGISTT